MADQVQDTSSIATEVDFDVAQHVEKFRNKLAELNDLYRLLLANNIYAHFYLGPNHVYTYLPTDAKFERITKERF